MKNKIIANTFTSVYDTVEDRIRVVINYQDFNSRVDFMITRSFILNLSQSVDEFMDKHYANSAVIKEQMVKDHSDLSTDSKEDIELPGTPSLINKTDNTDLELLRTNEELLKEVNLSINLESKQTTVTFSSDNVVAVALLNDISLPQTFQNIKSAIPCMQWGFAYDF